MQAKDVYRFNQLQLIKILLYFVLNTGVDGRITLFPGDSVVLKEKTNVFTCCSDVQKIIFWKHKPVWSMSTNDIYDLSGLVNGYLISGRFNVTSDNSSDCHSLITNNVTWGDEGMYSCTDNAGLGQEKGWELTILDTFACEEKNRKVEYMGVNDFGLPQDVISIVCISKYVGNVPPQKLGCEWSSGTELLHNYHHITETILATTVNIHIPAMKEFNGDQLSCYVKIDGVSSDNQTQTAWKSSHLIINYASFYHKRVLACSAEELSLDCHPPCNYSQIRFSNGSSFCEITYPSKSPQKLYVLLPDDNLPGTSNIHSSTNHAVECQTTPSRTPVALIGMSVVTGTVLLAIVPAVFIFLSCCKRRSSTQRGIGANRSAESTYPFLSATSTRSTLITFDRTSDVNSPRLLQTENSFGDNNDNTARAKFFHGDNTPANVATNPSDAENEVHDLSRSFCDHEAEKQATPQAVLYPL